jgi:membrane fusion protein (multidrug efflux system)
MSRKNQPILYCFLFAFSFLIISCGGNGNDEQADQKKKTTIPIEISQAELGDVSAVYSGTANLEAEEEAVVVAKTSGVVKKLFVEEGDYVQKGQLLAKLDDEQLLYRLNQAEANMKKAKSEYERNQEMYDKSLISADAYEKIKFDYESSKALYDLAKLDLNYSSIKAPISGVISQRFIKVGNMININESTFQITDFDPLNAVLYVPEQHMSKLQRDQLVELSADAIDDKSFAGYIKRISPVVDPGTGTFKVTVEVDDPQRILKPGMFGRVNIVYDTHKETLMIPKEALMTEDKESIVYIIRDSMAFKKVVQSGYTNSTHLEIMSGLSVGDTVVTIGQSSLKDSSLVQIVDEPAMALN